MKAFHARYEGEVQIYAVPLSGSAGKVKSFLKQEGLATLPVVPAARAAFSTASTHSVLVFRNAKASYDRINGSTPCSALEELFETFQPP